MPRISSFECSRCRHHVTADAAPNACLVCGNFLFVCYDMEDLKRTAKREDIALLADSGAANPGIWRYASVLPEVTPVTLGEGNTPLLRSRRSPCLFIKDEGVNPTGSFEARGMALAVAMAKNHVIQHLVIASEGDSAAALAGYAAAAGLEAHVFLPEDAAAASYLACVVYGADVTLTKGNIGDCEKVMREHLEAKAEGKETWLDVSELREPFRLEGLKTMGYEVVEQMGWEYPVAVVCPIGVVISAIWKAFDEMEQMEWVTGQRPRIYAAFAGPDDAKALEDKVIQDSGGRRVESGNVIEHVLDWGSEEAIVLSWDGAAAAGIYGALIASGELEAADRVVLINSGAGWKDADRIARAMRLRPSLPSSLPVGGIITPQ